MGATLNAVHLEGHEIIICCFNISICGSQTLSRSVRGLGDFMKGIFAPLFQESQTGFIHSSFIHFIL